MSHTHDVVIIGAGIGGLGMAARLLQEGRHDVVLLEKADAVGGTWRENTYPGAACDVQSHLYWYSFDDEQPDWSRLYAQQPEIQEAIASFAERHGLTSHVRLGAEVVGAAWDDATGSWRVDLRDGEQVGARVLITAWGQLNRPAFGGVEGRDSFAGESFHSAQWRHDVDLTGKRVAVVGNGASAVQIVPEIVDRVGALRVFQRSANYLVPRQDRPYENEERAAFREREQRLASRTAFFEEHESWVGAMMLEANPVSEEFYRLARELLDTQVADPTLRERLWPDYPLGCKRVLVADTYYPALCQDHVELVTDRIVAVEPQGVRTADGTLHEVDVIIYATGFETLSFLGELDVTGRHGTSLRETWNGAPSAYLGMSVPGFPNLFLLYGPNTNLGHNSIILMLECQYDYVLQALRALDEQPARALDVRPEVATRYDTELQEALRRTSFTGGCTSWYRTADGRVVNNWSGSVTEYQERTRTFVATDYEALQPALT